MPRLAALALAVGLLLAQTRGTHLGFTNDSVYYLSAAESIVHGEGLSSGVLFSERLARASNGETTPDLHRWPAVEAEPGEAAAAQATHPWTAWPLGFPLILAAFLVALPASVAAWACQATALVTFLVAIGALARRLAGDRFATAMMFLFAVLPCVHMSARALTSDLWCVTAAVLAIHALLAWWQTPTWRWLVAVSAAATACLLIRYLGAIVGAYAVAAVVYRVRRRELPGRAQISAALVVVAPLTLAAITMALRNKALSGVVGGVERLPSDRGLLTNVKDVAETFLSTTLPIVRDIPGRADLLVSGAFVVVLGALTIWQLRRARLRGALPEGLSLVLGFAFVYATILVIIRSRILSDELGPRLLLPSLVLVIVGLAGWLHARLPGNVAFALLLAYLPSYAVNLGAGAITKVDLWEGFNADEGLVRAAEVKQLVRDATSAKSVIYSDRAVEVHLALGVPVHWLPATASLEAIARRDGSASYVVSHRSGYFPDAPTETGYVAWLGEHADHVVHGPHFDVFSIPGATARAPSPDPTLAR